MSLPCLSDLRQEHAWLSQVGCSQVLSGQLRLVPDLVPPLMSEQTTQARLGHLGGCGSVRGVAGHASAGMVAPGGADATQRSPTTPQALKTPCLRDSPPPDTSGPEAPTATLSRTRPATAGPAPAPNRPRLLRQAAPYANAPQNRPPTDQITVKGARHRRSPQHPADPRHRPPRNQTTLQPADHTPRHSQLTPTASPLHNPYRKQTSPAGQVI